MINNDMQGTVQPRKNFDFDSIDFDSINFESNDVEEEKKDDPAEPATTSSAVSLTKPDIPNIQYRPETEQALINYVMSQNDKIEVATICVKWEIGRSINSFYQGKYASHELEKIARATGIGRDNLNKMIRFAEQYTHEQLITLIDGEYSLSWNGISQNLSIKPEKLIEVYEASSSISEFHNGIMKFKNPMEARGKSKKLKNDDKKTTDVEQPYEASPEIAVTAIPEVVDVIKADELQQICEEYEKKIEILKAENEQLKNDISMLNKQISDIRTAMDEDVRGLDNQDKIIEAYRDKYRQLRSMIENETDLTERMIMDLLVDVE